MVCEVYEDDHVCACARGWFSWVQGQVKTGCLELRQGEGEVHVGHGANMVQG